MKKISFVCPCFNEEGNVEKFYDLINTELSTSGFTYEVIFVNDGSTDDTFQKLKNIYENNKSTVKVVNFVHNFGKDAALLAGLKQAKGDYVCTIDTDLQQDPIYAIQMANLLENDEKIDMVVAKPEEENTTGLIGFCRKAFYFIINKFSETEFQNGASDFRVFRQSVCKSILSLPEHNRFSKGIFSWVSSKIGYIEYDVETRNSGESKWSNTKLTKYAINGIFAFSNLPLYFPFILGVIELIALSILLIAQIVCGIFSVEINYMARWFVMLGLFLASMQSFSTSIIAQYILRIHTETTNRPIYIIKEILKGDM